MRTIGKTVAAVAIVMGSLFALQLLASWLFLRSALDDPALCRISPVASRMVSSRIPTIGRPPDEYAASAAEAAPGQLYIQRWPDGSREIQRRLVSRSEWRPDLFLTVQHWGTREHVALLRFDGYAYDPSEIGDPKQLDYSLAEWRAHDRAWIANGGWVVYAILGAITVWLLQRNLVHRSARYVCRSLQGFGTGAHRLTERSLGASRDLSRRIDQQIERWNEPD